MNEQVMKMAVRMIGRENIQTAVNSLLEKLTQKLDSVELQGDESEAVIILHKEGKTNYATIATIDNKPEVPALKRQIGNYEINYMIAEMLKNI